MTERIFNFSSGPAMLPREVLEQAQDELLSFKGSGMSLMEISHRSALFGDVLAGAEASLRELLSVPQNYRILFLQGGASLQFSMVPMNLLRPGVSADYVITGAWGKKALAAADKCGEVRVVYSSDESGFRSIPEPSGLQFDPKAAYIHYTSNETIEGVEFPYDLDGGVVPVVCDASSNILSKPLDLDKYALIYAGAQKNIGPSGVTLVIIRDDLLEGVPADLHSMLDYRHFADNGSMPNTPNTWGIYLIGLVCEWLKQEGGLGAMEKRNAAKAERIYSTIDASGGFYAGHSDFAARSKMNVTFRLPNEELENGFCSEAEIRGLNGLRGHRSVGGIRASIYNAFPLEGVEMLIAFMQEFQQQNS